MEYLKLIGIVIIVLGFALKFDVLATVLLAGLVTGIVAGMDIPHILSILGESFACSYCCQCIQCADRRTCSVCASADSANVRGCGKGE